MKTILKLHFLLILLLVISMKTPLYAQDKPVVFNRNEGALSGEAVNLQGYSFGDNPEVWYTVVCGHEKELLPSKQIKIINKSDISVTALLPDSMEQGKNALSVLWIKNKYGFSDPVFINRARLISLEYEVLMPDCVFRIFGRNLVIPGYKPKVIFKNVKTGLEVEAEVMESDPYVLQARVSSKIVPGEDYHLIVSNGAGGNWGKFQSEDKIRIKAFAEDPFSLRVPWGTEFTFYKNIYNVKTDSRLKLKAKGDGIENDRNALQAAIDQAYEDGGGVVYLPSGEYKLDFSKGSGLIMRSNVVLKGDGAENSMIKFGYGTPPPYPDPIGVNGWPDNTTEGVVFLWPLGTKLSGMTGLKIQNVNTTGLWRHSLKTMAPSNNGKKPGVSGSRFFATDCDFELSSAWGLSWGYVDKMVISNCYFDSKTQATWPWLWHCDGSTNFVVRNNRVCYSAGRFGFSAGYNGIIENNQITRRGDLQTYKGETGGFNIDFSRNIVVMNNRMDVIGDSILDRNMGETILSQGGNPLNQSLGFVTEATVATLTDKSQNWGTLSTEDLYTCQIVAIVQGKGAGQWRRIISNDTHTIRIDRPWEIIPSKGSHYVVTSWSAENWLVKDNVLEENNRGIWFYCGGTDIAIVGNKLINSEGIYLRSDQRRTMTRYNLMWNAIVEDNTVIRTARKRPAHICSILAIEKDDTIHGIGSLGLEIRRNTVVTKKPNVESFIPGEGYWNEVQTRTPEVLTNTTGILGTVFEKNTIINADYGYRISERGTSQTVVKDPVNEAVGAILNRPNVSSLDLILEKKELSSDPFLPFLTGKAPEIASELGTETIDGVSIRKIVFNSRPYTTENGQEMTKVFAVIARPAIPGNYPGILIFHGGGGSAEIDKAKQWAAKGYIAVALDEPGVANPERIPDSQGPFRKLAYGQNRFPDSMDITQSTIFDAVVASLQGLYLLASQPDIIKDKIGVTGISWGGYLTTMITGLARDMIHASFSLYGTGFYDNNSTFTKELNRISLENRMIWLKWLDAGRRIKGVDSPFFIAAATNDNWFYPMAVKNTLQELRSGNHVFSPNSNHKIELPGGTQDNKNGVGWTGMEQVFFDYHLKGIGSDFPKVKELKTEKRKNNTIKVRFSVDASTPIVSAQISYSPVGVEWPERVWKTVLATQEKDGWYTSEVQIECPETSYEFYGTVSDSRPVSVSGNMVWFSGF